MQNKQNVIQPAGLEILLVRHGETEWSSESRYTSLTDIDLTCRGAAEAVAVGSWLRERGLIPSSIYSSPLERAKSSASQIADSLWGDPGRLSVLTELVELDFGPFEGVTAGELSERPEFLQWRTLEGTPVVPEGLESYESAAARFEAGISQFAGDEGFELPRRVCVVAHGHVMRAWLSLRVMGSPNPNVLQLDTGSISLVRFTSGGRRVIFLNLLPRLQDVVGRED